MLLSIRNEGGGERRVKEFRARTKLGITEIRGDVRIEEYVRIKEDW
jgi:hypothetical protein